MFDCFNDVVNFETNERIDSVFGFFHRFIKERMTVLSRFCNVRVISLDYCPSRIITFEDLSLNI